MFFDVYSDLCARVGKRPSAVAEELGINKSNVTNWKNNGYTPRGDALQKIADYFGCTTDYLLGIEEQKKSPPANTGQEAMDSIKRFTQDMSLADIKLMVSQQVLNTEDIDTLRNILALIEKQKT